MIEDSRVWWRGGAVLAVFVALTAALTYPLSLRPGTAALTAGADAQLQMWALAWNFHALLHQPLALFDANIFHPHDNTLAYSEHLFGVMLLAAPWLAASENLLLAYNAAALLSCVLSGAGAYVLARQLRLSVGAAVAAGIIFAFAPPRFLRFTQLHLGSVHWMPFCLAFLHRYLDSGRLRHLLITAGLFTLQALSSGHGALFLGTAGAALVAWRTIIGPTLPWRTVARDAAIAAVLLAALNVPFVLPYLEVRREEGLQRSLRSAEHWSPNAVSFIASPTWAHRAVLRMLPSSPDLGRARAILFPGYLTLVLAAVALWRRPSTAGGGGPRGEAANGWQAKLRRRLEPYGGAQVVFYAWLGLMALWASLGPSFGLYRWLYHLPGFDFIRVPSRLTILTLLCLAVLAGAGLDRLRARLAPPRRTWLTTAVVIGLVIEFAAVPLAVRPFTMRIPAVDRWLASQERPFVIAEVPVPSLHRTRTARLQARYMLHATAHWQPTVNGYSGFSPQRSRALHTHLTRFPDEPSIRALAKVGVTYVVVHRDYYPVGERAGLDRRLQEWSSRLRLEFSADEGRVYRLLDPPR